MVKKSWASLRAAVGDLAKGAGSVLGAPGAEVHLRELERGSIFGGRLAELCGRSVLIAARSQLTAALAMIELDGSARRMVLCPADLPLEHLGFVAKAVSADAIVSDRSELESDISSLPFFVPANPSIFSEECDRSPRFETEWILLTSGTTGPPKMVVHTLTSLAGAIRRTGPLADGFVWSTFYDICRYGGLQIFLRAVLTGGSLVLSGTQELTAEFLVRAGASGVTHISGTPTHWRKVLMSPSARSVKPQYIRLSGEIAHQSILDELRAFYPQAKVTHAFASTEAGVAFDVTDGLEGFPASFVGCRDNGVEMKVEDGSLRIRSPRIGKRYLGSGEPSIADQDGFVDTRDMVEFRNQRYCFVGRRDGIINVGGLKVHPEEVERAINRHPMVSASLARARKNSIMGAIVVADVQLNTQPEPSGAGREQIEQEIVQLCRQTLAPHKVPVAISFVNELAVASTGKMARREHISASS